MCIQLTHLSYEDCENTYTLSYYQDQIGSTTHLPLFRIRLWNNGICRISFYIFTQKQSFLFEKTLILRPFSHLPDQGVMQKMDHYTRAFTLVAKWGNSPGWHIYTCISHICVIYHSSHLCHSNEWHYMDDIDGLVQNFSISTANALEILQFCTKPSTWPYHLYP